MENIRNKGLKFTLNYNFKENFYKIMYHWYLTPDKLSKMYSGVTNVCWRCSLGEETISHLWWTCEQICANIQKILKVDLTKKARTVSLGFDGEAARETTWDFAFIHDYSSKNFICTKMERSINTFSGGLDY